VKELRPAPVRWRLLAEAGLMRTKTPAVWLTSVLKLAVHSAMGVAVGLAFSLILTMTDPGGIITLINHSDTPGITLAMFVGTIILSFAIGATLTGLVFMVSEDD
jgi:hypothetical protein